MDGTITTTFLAALNSGGGFAGHTDWRIPNVSELQTLVDFGRVAPTIDPVFNTDCAPACTVLMCSCTATTDHWSSSTDTYDPAQAWLVQFYVGFTNSSLKYKDTHVRAVRGGS
jgi:predicted GNAT family N-acyltransferase